VGKPKKRPKRVLVLVLWDFFGLPGIWVLGFGLSQFGANPTGSFSH
jgi:hypothetical protein